MSYWELWGLTRSVEVEELDVWGRLFNVYEAWFNDKKSNGKLLFVMLLLLLSISSGFVITNELMHFSLVAALSRESTSNGLVECHWRNGNPHSIRKLRGGEEEVNSKGERDIHGIWSEGKTLWWSIQNLGYTFLASFTAGVGNLFGDSRVHDSLFMRVFFLQIAIICRRNHAPIVSS